MEEKKILIDTHIHTKGISWCSQLVYSKLIDVCIEDGLNGIVLTNHYKSCYYDMDFKYWQKKYIDEYHLTKEYAEKKKFKVFFGVEVTLDSMPSYDFVIYGLEEKDFLQNIKLSKLSIEELSQFAHDNNSLLFHVHPYRNGSSPFSPSLFDGTEINCHPIYLDNAEMAVRKFADDNNLILTCGSDYHGDCYKAKCGTYIPDSINTNKELVNFFRLNKRPELVIAPNPIPGMDLSVGKGVLPFSNEETHPNMKKILFS